MANTLNPDVGNRVWTKFVRIENGKPVEITDAPLMIRTDTGQRPTDEWLVQEGFRGFVDALPPSYNKYEQKVIKTELANLTVNTKTNIVTQTYSVVPLTAEEKAGMEVTLKNEINAERKNRIEIGTIISVSNVGDVLVRGTQEDMRNLSNLGQLANMYVSSNTNTNIVFRDGNNVMHTLTPAQMSELWQKSVAYVSAVYQASWTMKDMNPLPQDFRNDTYWPDRTL